MTPGNGVAVQWRTAQGGSSSQVTTTGTVPTYLQIGRYTSGGTTYYTAYTSPDGVDLDGRARLDGDGGRAVRHPPGRPGRHLPRPGDQLDGRLQRGVVDGHRAARRPASAARPAGPARTSGSPLPLGQQTLTGSTWSVSGGGGDIWGTSDSFHLVNQTLAADGTVSAQVTSQTATDPWAKAGVMVRATTDPGFAPTTPPS